MKPTLARRVGTTVVAGLVVVLAGAGAEAVAKAAPAAVAPLAAVPTVAPSCGQQVAPGHYTCFALKRTDIHEPRALAAQAVPSGYGPADLKSAYNLPASGTSATVAVVDAFDDPTAESDLAAYRAQYGLPACTSANGCFTKLNQDGKTSPLPAPDATGWAGEISLDLDMVSAICSSCHIALIEADDATDNLFSAVKAATGLGYTYISMSWGGQEDGTEPAADAKYFAASGVVYTASSGDSGYSAGVIYPSTSNRVVSVGGTSLSRASNSRGWSESVWGANSAGTDGTGSGCSADEPKPSWQSLVPDTACGHRADTDVSAVADPNTGVAVYDTYDGGGGWAVYGGTSAAAPIVASVYALAGTPAAADHPASYPYEHPSNLNDVAAGANGTCSPAVLCTAGSGWDGPTGLGTPNGLTAFTPGNTVTVTSPGDQTGSVGSAVSVQIKANDTAVSAPLTYRATGLPTGLSIDAATGLISGTPTVGGVADVTVTVTDPTGATGVVGFSWTINGVGTGCAGQVLANPGFEAGAKGWTASDGVVNTDGAYARTGSGYAWLDGYGTTHTATLSQKVTIPSGCKATLDYYLWTTTYKQDRQTTDTLVLTVNGSRVQTFSNTDHTTGYLQRSVSLSRYAGQTVTITWTGQEHGSPATSFFLDDTALTLS